MKRVAIYARKSIFEENSNSTSNQINMVKEYMRRFGECKFYVFEDEGFSGGNINRPDFKRMISMAENNEIDTVATYKIDRIARNIVDFVNTYDMLQKHNVSLVSVTEAFDLGTSMGKLIMMILATFAEMERENTRQRVRDNKIENAKLGKWTGGTKPFGYNIITVTENEKQVKYLEMNKQEAPIVKGIFNKVIELQNLSAVSRWCHTNNNIFNTVASLKRILINPMYVKSNNEVIEYLKRDKEVYGQKFGKGILLFGDRSRDTKKKISFYATGTHDGIIDPDQWLKVQGIIKFRHQAQKKWSNVSFLSGMVICKHCGSKMWVFAYGTAEKRYYSFMCPHRMKKKKCTNSSIVTHLLEEKVDCYLHQITINKETFCKAVNRKDNSTIVDNNLKKIKSDINKKEKDIQKLTEKLILFEDSALDIVTKKMNTLSKEIQTLKENLFISEKEKIFSSNEQINLDYMFDQIKYFNKLSDKLTVEEKRKILNKIISRVEWDGLARECNVII